MSKDHSNNETDVTAIEITKIVEDRLPNWKKVCDHPGADVVILSQLAFGNSDDELLLLAVAVKYAGMANKDVSIAATRQTELTTLPDPASSSAKRYSFYPYVAKRPYCEIADLLSPQALYTFEVMRTYRDRAPFSLEQIEEMSRDAERRHGNNSIEQYLSELVRAECLIVELSSDS